MKQVILYGSRYGSTKQYALELAKRANVECHCFKEKIDLSGYDLIVYMGSLYGGAVNGLKKTAKHFPKNAKIIVVTAGILDITVKDNYDYVKKTTLSQLPNDIVSNTQVFCLMGKSEYSTMKFMDRMIMSIVHKGMSQKPENERTKNESVFIDNFKTVVDMIDFDSLNPIVDAMEK